METRFLPPSTTIPSSAGLLQNTTGRPSEPSVLIIHAVAPYLTPFTKSRDIGETRKLFFHLERRTRTTYDALKDFHCCSPVKEIKEVMTILGEKIAPRLNIQSLCFFPSSMCKPR